MLMDMIILFIILTIIFLILSLYTIQDKPYYSIVFIFLGMIFSVLTTYSMFDVEYFYIGYNATYGNTTTEIYNTTMYGEPYGYIFFFVFFVFCVLFFVAGFFAWQQALKQPGEMDMKTKHRRL